MRGHIGCHSGVTWRQTLRFTLPSNVLPFPLLPCGVLAKPCPALPCPAPNSALPTSQTSMVTIGGGIDFLSIGKTSQYLHSCSHPRLQAEKCMHASLGPTASMSDSARTNECELDHLELVPCSHLQVRAEAKGRRRCRSFGPEPCYKCGQPPPVQLAP